MNESGSATKRRPHPASSFDHLPVSRGSNRIKFQVFGFKSQERKETMSESGSATKFGQMKLNPFGYLPRGEINDYDRENWLSSLSGFSIRPFANMVPQGNQYDHYGERNMYPGMYPRSADRSSGFVSDVHRGRSTTYQPVEILKPLSPTVKSKEADHPISLGANSIPQTVVERPSVGLNDSSLTLKSASTKRPPTKLDELNSDFLEEIEKHLDGSSSVALAQVNRKLRFALSNMNLSGGRQPPYLMLSESSHSETCCFLRLDDIGIIELPLPAATGKKVWGSPHGWLVTMDPTLQLHFLNIFSQVQEPLPPLLPMIDHIRQHGMVTLAFLTQLDWFSMVHKCLVFKIFPTEFLVIIILRPANVLCFTKPRKIPQWALMSNPENYVFRDVAFFQGQVYALCDNGSIVKINFHESDPAATATRLVVSNPEGETTERSYLLASPDHLYGVFRYDDEDDGSTTFVVYKLNFGSLKWETVWSIEDYAFFVGSGNSFCFSPASRVNYKRNCIYFTYDDKLELMLPNEGRFDFGIYNLDTWDTDLKLVTAESVPSPHSCPTWIAHGLTPPNFRN